MNNRNPYPKIFLLGCNYWASHAGTAMWSDWRPDVIKSDLDLLVGIKANTLRVFPLWPDFQPLHILRRGSGQPYEYRFGEEPLPATEEGCVGVSQVMLDRFQVFADLAHDRGLQLIVGLVTGWMSGRLFVPPALEGKNILTDPEAIMWQVRFVKCFVRRFSEHPAITAWDLGNECNCMADAKLREAAWQWTACITGAIRSEDSRHRIVSGMHSLAVFDPVRSNQQNNPWTIEDQGELTDILTIHPYPIFTPHCDRDPINTPRGTLHATAEGVLYADIGGKPCFAEEVGTLGPFISSEKIAADYLRTVLYSLWSHGNLGMLWWCGFDQEHLEQAPYDWCAVERKLGLFHQNSPKPVADEVREFASFIQGMPTLPKRICEAVCILSEGQDAWGAAYASFILAKQAGFDLSFQSTTQPLRVSSLYMLPSMVTPPSRKFGMELMKKVEAGATLYVSIDNAWLSDIMEWFGVEVQTRRQRSSEVVICWDEEKFTLSSSYRFDMRAQGAEVIATEDDGNPAFTSFTYGNGKVYFLTVPLETYLVRQPGVFCDEKAKPWHFFYKKISENVRGNRILRKAFPHVGITEHPLDDSSRYAVVINYGIEKIDLPLSTALGWKVSEVIRGISQNGMLKLGSNDSAILKLRK